MLNTELLTNTFKFRRTGLHNKHKASLHQYSIGGYKCIFDVTYGLSVCVV